MPASIRSSLRLASTLVALALPLPHGAAAAGSTTPALQPRIAALLHEQGLPGAVWTTLDAQGGAGVRDARSGAAMRGDERVLPGSIAKTVLATGILRLVTERRLALDTPVAGLLPGLEFDNRWAASDPVRIRHLLDHTSGLDDARFWQVFTMQARADAPLAAAFPPGRGLLRSRHRPGTRVSYSNMGYTLLGMVIETVTGQRYEHYLDTQLLAPLGMRDSTFGFVTQHGDRRLAMGHFEGGATQPVTPSYVRPAGQFTTTAADMGRFARFLMSDGRVSGKPFVDPVLLGQMGEPAGTEAARAGLGVGYALGLRKVDRHGVVAKCHSGNTIGFRAMLCLFPSTRQGFFLAINGDSETADYHRFDALLIGALGLHTPVPARPAAPAFDTGAWHGWYVPAPNRFDSMRFLDHAFGFLHVTGDGTSLRIAALQSADIVLRHAGEGLFQAPGKLLPSHALLTLADGTRVMTNGTQSHEQVSMAGLLALWASIAAGMAGLAAILVMAAMRLARRKLSARDPLCVPFAGVLALLLPLPLFYRQSFLQLGDVTAASVVLAATTAALPLAMLVGLAAAVRRPSRPVADMAVLAAVLQLALVLAAWGLLPLRLWM
ncbi:serine hydrolase domain-containing protein [Pseudoduganella lutea]|nr:serine hydrolase domain-containing protein [Pseudoduganella lutea]